MRLPKNLLTVILISLTLCGVQVVQASPLHDHASHVVDCTLCHFDSSEAVITFNLADLGIDAYSADSGCTATPAPVTSVYPAFFGRAPPRFSL